jgi:high affinity Mn2+ porin
LNQDWWTFRLGLFDLSRMPNEPALVRGFGQYELGPIDIQDSQN